MNLQELFNNIITRAINDGYGENKAKSKLENYKKHAINVIGLSDINAKHMALEKLEEDLCEFEFNNNFNYTQFSRTNLNIR